MGRLEEIFEKIEMSLQDNKTEMDYLKQIQNDLQEKKDQLTEMQASIQRNITVMEKKFKENPSSEEGSMTPIEKDTQTQIERTKKYKENLLVDLQKSMANLQISNEELGKLTSDRENIRDNNSVKLEKLRYDVDLYTNITGIRWQYDCEEDERRGYISKRGVLKPFSLNTKKHSPFFIANYLWDLMEQS